MKKFFAVLIVFLLILPSFSYSAQADGIPVTVLHGYSAMRENYQLAYIDAYGNSERMHLFLSVDSLDPGEPLTILVPLRTHPSDISMENMSNRDFRQRYDFSEIHDLHKKQTNGTERFRKEMTSMFPEVLVAEIGGLPLFLWAYAQRPVSAGISSYEHYEGKGLSVDVYSFNSSDSLSDFYESMGVSVPQEVQETITKYGDFSVAVIRAVTKLPIPEDEYEALERYVPEVISNFRDFVETHEEIYMVGGWPNIPDEDFQDMLWKVHKKEMEMGGSVPLESYFRDLVLSTYGFGDVEGFEISMNLPLYEGKAFYPLGTSPAWKKVGKIEIMFSCHDSLDISFDGEMEEAFYNGKHYYLWSSENSAPDYDLEGDLTPSEDILKPVSWVLNGILYDLSPVLAFMIYLSIIALLFSPMVFAYERKRYGGNLKKRGILEFIFLSYITAMLSLVLSFVLTFIVLAMLYFRTGNAGRNIHRLSWHFRVPWFICILMPFLFFLIFLTPFFFPYHMEYFIMEMFFYFLLGASSYVILYLGLRKLEESYEIDRKEKKKIRGALYAGSSLSIFSLLIFIAVFLAAQNPGSGSGDLLGFGIFASIILSFASILTEFAPIEKIAVRYGVRDTEANSEEKPAKLL